MAMYPLPITHPQPHVQRGRGKIVLKRAGPDSSGSRVPRQRNYSAPPVLSSGNARNLRVVVKFLTTTNFRDVFHKGKPRGPRLPCWSLRRIKRWGVSQFETRTLQAALRFDYPGTNPLFFRLS